MRLTAVIKQIEEQDREAIEAAKRQGDLGPFADLERGFNREDTFVTSASPNKKKGTITLDQFLMKAWEGGMDLKTQEVGAELTSTSSLFKIGIYTQRNSRKDTPLFDSEYSVNDQTQVKLLEIMSQDKFYVGYSYKTDGQTDRRLAFAFSEKTKTAAFFVDTSKVEEIEKLTVTGALNYVGVKGIAELPITAPSSDTLEQTGKGTDRVKRAYTKRTEKTGGDKQKRGHRTRQTEESLTAKVSTIKKGTQGDTTVIRVNKGYQYASNLDEKQICDARVNESIASVKYNGKWVTTIGEIARYDNRPKLGGDVTIKNLAERLGTTDKKIIKTAEELEIGIKGKKLSSRSASAIYDAMRPKLSRKELTAIVKDSPSQEAAEGATKRGGSYKERGGSGVSYKNVYLTVKDLAELLSIDEASAASSIRSNKEILGSDPNRIAASNVEIYIKTRKRRFTDERKEMCLKKLYDFVSGYSTQGKTETAATTGTTAKRSYRRQGKTEGAAAPKGEYGPPLLVKGAQEKLYIPRKIVELSGTTTITREETMLYTGFDRDTLDRLEAEKKLIRVKGDTSGDYTLQNIKEVLGGNVSLQFATARFKALGIGAEVVPELVDQDKLNKTPDGRSITFDSFANCIKAAYEERQTVTKEK